MLRIRLLDPNKTYVFLGIGYRSDRGGSFPGRDPWTIAIPLSPGGEENIVFSDKDTSRFVQGYSRSPTGMTEVTHLKVDGDLVICSTPERINHVRETVRTHSLRASSLTSMRIGMESSLCNYAPGYSASDYQSTVESATLYPFMTYQVGRSSYSWIQQYRSMYLNIIGTGDSGSRTFSYSRAHALDQLSTTVEWSVDRQAGTIKVRIVCDYRGPYFMYTKENVTPSSSDKKMTNARGSWEFNHTFTVSDYLREGLQTGKNLWNSRDNWPSASPKCPFIMTYYKDGKKVIWRERQCSANFYVCYHIGYLPRDLVYPRAYIKGLKIDGLLTTCQDTEDWEIGSQYVPYGSDTDNYQFGRKGGRDRGGATIYSELQERGIKNNRFYDGNFWMLFQDLSNLVGDFQNLKAAGVEDVYQLWRWWKRKGSKMDTAKAAANTYLPLKYGYKLTLEDCLSFFEGIVRAREELRGFSQCRFLGPEREQESLSATPFIPEFSGKQVFCWQATVLPEPNMFSGVFAFLNDFSMWLSVEDAWDWIPYSFVIDWIVSTPKKFVQDMDWHAWKANFDLVEACRSYKLIGDCDARRVLDALSGLIDPGQRVTISYYHRNWSKRFDPPPYYREQSSGPATALSHWVELGALTIQRA